MKRHFFGTLQKINTMQVLENYLKTNFPCFLLLFVFFSSNSDVQRVLMISRVFAITRFLQKRSNKPRLLMIPMCLMIAGLLSTSFLLLLALSKREGETNIDMWTTKVYISNHFCFFNHFFEVTSLF